MEYIELDVKQLIYELSKVRVAEYSVELNCELFGTDLNRIYATNVYHGNEKDGVVEVVADFTCRIQEPMSKESPAKGSFRGVFNIDQKCFIENTCEVRL